MGGTTGVEPSPSALHTSIASMTPQPLNWIPPLHLIIIIVIIISFLFTKGRYDPSGGIIVIITIIMSGRLGLVHCGQKCALIIIIIIIIIIKQTSCFCSKLSVCR